MKAGYRVYASVDFKTCKLIEVCNDIYTNEVINYGWKLKSSYNASKDENTVGVWKLKQLKN